MRGPGGRKAVRRIAVTCGLAAVAALSVPGVSTSADAGGGTSCPIPIDRQINSIRKFAPIASFLTREPRCVNCHGGVNPFISGIGTDPEDANAPPSTTLHEGGQIDRQGDRAPDGTLLIESGCMECHSNMAPRRDGSKSTWMTAPGFLSFVGKDAPTLCKQIKRSTHTASDFLGHLKDDNGGNNFSATAFRGDRALDPDAFHVPPAPPSLSHAAFMRLGQDWVDAMGGSFQGDESCGCEVKLRGKFTYIDTGDLGPMHDVTRITGELIWANKDEGAAATAGDADTISFRPVDGEIKVEIEFENRGLEGQSSCKGRGSKSFSVADLRRGALRHMQLEIGEDGRYELTLVIPDTPDPFPKWEFESTCAWPNVTAHDRVPVHSVSMILGRHEGGLDEQQGITGQLPAPIRRGPRTITGNWSFSSADR